MDTLDEIFKAYDIRGTYPDQVNGDLAVDLGKAIVGFLSSKKIVVGRDMRTSSDELFDKLVYGITTSGTNVIDIGLVSTPTFYYACKDLTPDGGVMITASHNPKEYNGFKIVGKEIAPVSSETGLREIKENIVKKRFIKTENTGKVEKVGDMLERHIENDFKLADVIKQDIGPLKIVADAANAMGIPYLKEVFRRLPCELIPMNFELDGTFPAHEANPLKPETLIELQKKIKEEGADLGIATDGDGDRIGFIDNEGKIIKPDHLIGLLAKEFLREYPGRKIAYDIRCSWISRESIEEAGGTPIVTRVGHTFVKKVMRAEKILFAGEISAHYYFGEGYFYEVPVVVILKLLGIISKEGKSIAEIMRPYQKYFQSEEINFEVGDKEAKIRELKKKYGKEGQLSLLDGIRVDFKEWWFNVRPSNTEPLLRLKLEAKTKELAGEKERELEEVIGGRRV